jgi:ADP-ribose pyrophosphatase YjhB (NUDIX family)
MIRYCNTCGNPTSTTTPPGDDRLRQVCHVCDTVHYENPKVVVGCIPQWEEKILLCLRAIEPRYGKWTLPAGFLEIGETVAEGAKRETLEEASARVDDLIPYALFNLSFIGQIYIMFRARLVDTYYKPGSESLSVALFSQDEIPWNDLAFPVVEKTLKKYFTDRKIGKFPFFIEDIIRSYTWEL